MTTIACDRTTMAADTQLTRGTSISNSIKIHRIRGNLVGCAGEFTSCLRFVQWYKDGCQEDMDAECMENVDALVLDTKGRIHVYGCDQTPFTLTDRFAAIGSGGDVARGAMAHGATPKQAVETAKKFDAATGGQTTVKRITTKTTKSK